MVNTRLSLLLTSLLFADSKAATYCFYVNENLGSPLIVQDIAYGAPGRKIPTMVSTIATRNSVFPPTCWSTYCQLVDCERTFTVDGIEYNTYGQVVDTDQLNFNILGEEFTGYVQFTNFTLKPSLNCTNNSATFLNFPDIYTNVATDIGGDSPYNFGATWGVAPGGELMGFLNGPGNTPLAMNVLSTYGQLGFCIGMTIPLPPGPLYETFSKAVPEWPLWTLPLTNLTINGTALGVNGIAVIDSTRPYIQMPLVIANTVAGIIGLETGPVINGRQTYGIASCSGFNMTMRFNTHEFQILPETLFQPDCQARFVGYDELYRGDPIWRLGGPFMDTAALTFDYTNDIVTLAYAIYSK